MLRQWEYGVVSLSYILRSPDSGLCPRTCLSRRRGLGLASSGSAASSCSFPRPSLSRPQVRTHNDVDKQAPIPAQCYAMLPHSRPLPQRQSAAAVAGSPLPCCPNGGVARPAAR
jgi:hypothetical protein